MPAQDIQLNDDMLDTSKHLDKVFGVKSEAEAPVPQDKVVPPTETVVAKTDAPPPRVVEKSITPPAPAPKAGDEETAVVAPKPGETPVDPLESITLSPHAKPSTAEAFNKVKETAKAEIAKREQELAQLRKEREEFQRKLEQAPPPDVLTELEELRKWRESVATEADPVFHRKFDEPIGKIDETIYAKLKEIGATDEHIAKIKELGGVENVDLDALVLNPATRRFIEAKLVQKQELQEARKQAASSGEVARKKFLEEERAAREAAEKGSVKKRLDTFTGMVTKMDAFKPLQPEKDATEEQRKQIERANQFVAERVAFSRDLLSQDLTPELQAELGVGLALAYIYGSERDGLVQEVESLRKENESYKQKLEAVEAASRTIRTERQIINPPKTALPGAESGKSASEALDEFVRSRTAS